MHLIEKVRVAYQSRFIDEDLPYVASMMAAMARSGMDLTDIFLSLQGEETFSRPTRSLLSSIITESQNESLSVVLNERSKFYGGRIQSFLSGLAVETMKGNITPFLESFTAKLIAEKLREEREATTLEEVLSIIFATLFVLGPMVLMIIVSLLGFLSTPLLPLAVWFQNLFFFYVPIGTLFFTSLGWKKEPLKHAAPFIFTSIIFLFVGIESLDLFIPMAGLIFLPLGLYELRIWLNEKSIDQHLSTFLKDFSFQLLSGRDFLQTFKSLGMKRYGKLSQILHKIVNAMELGETFTLSIRQLLNKTITSRRIATLMTSLMRKGGDVSKIMESISDFSMGIYEIDTERRKRQYLTIIFFYIFFIVFLFLATSILQFQLTITPVSEGNIPITKTLFAASIISAVCTGLVAGILSTKRIGVGGIHVFLFTVMSMTFYYSIWNIP